MPEISNEGIRKTFEQNLNKAIINRSTLPPQEAAAQQVEVGIIEGVKGEIPSARMASEKHLSVTFGVSFDEGAVLQIALAPNLPPIEK